MWFTIEIQASNADGTIWQALEPAEDVDGTPWGYTSAAHIAQMVASHQNLAEGEGWRVCVWNGADADTGIDPAYIWNPDETRHFTAWLVVDSDHLETGFAEVLVLRDELRSPFDDEPEQWDSVGEPLTILRTDVNVREDGIIVHAAAQAQAEELLTENGWRATDDWRWEVVDTNYVVTVELANG